MAFGILDVTKIDFSQKDKIETIYQNIKKSNNDSWQYKDEFTEVVKKTFAEDKTLDWEKIPEIKIYQLIGQRILELKTEKFYNTPSTTEELVAYTVELYKTIFTMGPLEELLKDEDVTDIIIHSYDNISIARRSKNGLEKFNQKFSSDEQLKGIMSNILSRYNSIQVDQAHPIRDGILSNGERLLVVISPIAVNGTVAIIRKQSKRIFKPEDLIKFKSFNQNANKFMELSVQSECNTVIVGATGSGKTALVSALLNYIPKDEHTLIIEDTIELQVPETHKNVTNYKTRINEENPDTNVTIYDLLKAALRSFPKYIIVGETRGAEAWEMLQAMKSGHSGITTIHAEDGPDAISRLEGMMMLAKNDIDIEYLRRDLAQVMDLFIIQKWIGRKEDNTYRRGISAIYEITPSIEKENEMLEDIIPNTTTLTREKILKDNPKFVQSYGSATLRKIFYYDYDADELLPGVLPSDKLMDKFKEKGLYEDFKKVFNI